MSPGSAIHAGRRRAVLGAALTLGAVVGALGWGSVGSGDGANGNGLSAIVVGVGAKTGPSSNSPGTGQVTLLLRNNSRVDATLRTPTLNDQSGYALKFNDRDIQVPAGGSQQVELGVLLFCDRALTFGLAPLRVVASAPGHLTVPVAGAQPEASRQCDLTSDSLMTAVAQREDRRLRIDLLVPSGRSERVVDVRAQGVSLTRNGLSVMIAGRETTLWLDPPAQCPAAWAAGGIPVSVEVLTRNDPAQPPASFEVKLGWELSAWILDEVCQ